MKLLAASCVCTLALLATSASAQSFDSPQYLGWSPWRVGASATTQTSVVADGNKMTVAYTATLKAVNADSVVVDIATTIEAEGMKFTSPAAPTTYFAKIPGAQPKATKGKETLTVNGRKLDCEWTEVASAEGATTKTWTCPNVPGGMVQETIRDGGSTTTMQLIDWQGQKK